MLPIRFHCAGPAVFKMSGSFRAKASASSHESAMPDSFKMSSMAAAAVDIPPPPDAPKAPAHPSRPAEPTSTKPHGSEGNDPSDAKTDVQDVDAEAIDIPSPEMIRLAKEKRQRLRGAHMAPGYVPSDNPVFQKAADYRKAEDVVKKGSDDESDDDDNDDLRLKFSGGTFPALRRCTFAMLRVPTVSAVCVLHARLRQRPLLVWNPGDGIPHKESPVAQFLKG